MTNKNTLCGNCGASDVPLWYDENNIRAFCDACWSAWEEGGIPEPMTLDGDPLTSEWFMDDKFEPIELDDEEELFGPGKMVKQCQQSDKPQNPNFLQRSIMALELGTGHQDMKDMLLDNELLTSLSNAKLNQNLPSFSPQKSKSHRKSSVSFTSTGCSVRFFDTLLEPINGRLTVDVPVKVKEFCGPSQHHMNYVGNSNRPGDDRCSLLDYSMSEFNRVTNNMDKPRLVWDTRLL